MIKGVKRSGKKMTLQTRYMNLLLKNPIIVASSGLSKSEDKIRACEEAGAAAVVMKSLFEEAIAREEWNLAAGTLGHTEAYDYLRAELDMQYGPQQYCAALEAAKKSVKIPVIASVNCVSAKWWPSYARQFESAGADAIELNVYAPVADARITSDAAEQLYLDILAAVKEQVKIPVAMKIGRHFSALPNLAARLAANGLDALVLFNRFTDFSIDIHTRRAGTTFEFSRPEEHHEVLRWVALLSGQTRCDLAATTGLHSGEDIIKMLLAGARAVQLASALYQKGLDLIPALLKEIEAWMKEQGCEDLASCIGSLNMANSHTPELYLRAQFMEKIRGWE
jgi:dihydroorotate dehydrogenase (fumarate)